MSQGSAEGAALAGLSLAYPVSPTGPGQASLRILPAISTDPAVPSELAAGKSWSGTFSGEGALPNGKAIFVVFGYFTPRGSEGFKWITDHSFALARASS